MDLDTGKVALATSSGTELTNGGQWWGGLDDHPEGAGMYPTSESLTLESCRAVLAHEKPVQYFTGDQSQPGLMFCMRTSAGGIAGIEVEGRERVIGLGPPIELSIRVWKV